MPLDIKTLETKTNVGRCVIIHDSDRKCIQLRSKIN